MKYDGIVGNGTSQQQITIPMVNKKCIISPNIKILDDFGKITKTFWDRIDLLKKQNTNLAKQRDLLLPRLMSGKLAC